MASVITPKRPAAEPDILLAVMGPTGSGKSTFVNLISGSNLAIGEGLRSCTNGVQTGLTFEFGGRQVTLVDTPGFDDTTVSDTDVLKMISAFLSSSYQGGYKLTGVIYMHRISDFRVGGIARKNFHMFRKLCGDDSLKNVLIVTNMWGMVSEAKGRERELELQSDDLLFKPALDKGAKMVRHYNTAQSAKAILEKLVKQRPQALRIQRELVEEGMDIAQTAAGKELDRELALLMEKHKVEMASLQQQMADAIAEKDTETRKELEAVKEELKGKMNGIVVDRDRLSRDYEVEKGKMQQMINDLTAERENGAKLREQLQTLIEELNSNKEATAAERDELRRQIDELRNQQHTGGGGGGCSIF